MAGNLLWAHLLRKDATTAVDSPSQIPPIAPQDKTGTSMRMLIHDTQVNLEKFSTRLDSLLQRVDDCRAHVVNANKLLDVERDKVLAEILEIAHRCQSEMKTHVGTPAQAPALDLVHVSQVSTERSVQGLEKRIDALQALLQTHTHAMQSIQDQQNTLIGAVLQLVPVLHGVSPQMDQIKTALSDMVANAVSTMTNSVESVRSTLVTELAHGCGHARSSTRLGSLSKSVSSLRRKRPNASMFDPEETNVLASSPLVGRTLRGHRLSLKRARVEGEAHCTGDTLLSRKLSRLTAPLTNSGNLPPLLRTPRTPRQPLADLPLIPGSNTSRVQPQKKGHLNSTSHRYMRSRDTLGAAEAPPVSRQPLQPLEHVVPHAQDPTITRQPSVYLAIEKSVMGLQSTTGSSDKDALSKEIKIEEILKPNLTGIFSVHSSPLSSPPLSLQRHDPNETSMNVAQAPTQQRSRLQDDMPDIPQIGLDQVPPPLSGLSSNLETSPPKSMSLRDRRAQMSMFGRTETRRFIPLVPWSDEEE